MKMHIDGFMQERLQCIIGIELCLFCIKAAIHNHIWRHRTRSTSAQIMAWCLMAPSHYLNQCWFIICKVMLHLSKDVIMNKSEYSIKKNITENRIFKIVSTSPRSQWVHFHMKRTFIHVSCAIPHCPFILHISPRSYSRLKTGPVAKTHVERMEGKC